MINSNVMQFMLLTFQKEMDKAAARGDKNTFDKMQQQVEWLQQQQINKYK
jgi:uncharacterized membrane protein (DUF106 family)